MHVSWAVGARHIFFAVPVGQVVAEQHNDDLHASGLLDMLREILTHVKSCVATKHSASFPAGDNETFEHLRRERILTAEGCYVRANSKYVERAASLLGLEKKRVNLSRYHLPPTTGMMLSVVRRSWAERLRFSIAALCERFSTWDIIEVMQITQFVFWLVTCAMQTKTVFVV